VPASHGVVHLICVGAMPGAGSPHGGALIASGRAAHRREFAPAARRARRGFAAVIVVPTLWLLGALETRQNLNFGVAITTPSVARAACGEHTDIQSTSFTSASSRVTEYGRVFSIIFGDTLMSASITSFNCSYEGTTSSLARAGGYEHIHNISSGRSIIFIMILYMTFPAVLSVFLGWVGMTVYEQMHHHTWSVVASMRVLWWACKGRLFFLLLCASMCSHVQAAHCNRCFGAFASCDIASTGYCVADTPIGENSAAVVAGAGTPIFVALIAPRYLRMISKPVCDTLLALFKLPAPGTQMAIEQDTSASSIITAIDTGRITVSGALAALADLLETVSGSGSMRASVCPGDAP